MAATKEERVSRKDAKTRSGNPWRSWRLGERNLPWKNEKWTDSSTRGVLLAPLSRLPMCLAPLRGDRRMERVRLGSAIGDVFSFANPNRTLSLANPAEPVPSQLPNLQEPLRKTRCLNPFAVRFLAPLSRVSSKQRSTNLGGIGQGRLQVSPRRISRISSRS
jgi:hypothetical protein